MKATTPLLLFTALLPLLPHPVMGQSSARPAATRQQESLGRFLQRLASAETGQAEAMLDSMADINAATDQEQITAIHTAIAYNRLDILHMLLQRGAKTELLMRPGLTPLAAAAMKNDTDAISMLLSHGAQINHQTPGGVNALKLACAKGNLDAAQVLLAHGADPTTADADGQTALTLAQEHAGDNRLPLMLMLLEHGADPNTPPGEKEWSPLMAALIAHDLPTADLLLTHGANVDPQDASEATPLMVAAGFGYTSLVQRMLEQGANVIRQDDDGNDALDHAAIGARVTHGIVDKAHGEVPAIHNTSEVNSAATCRLLLERGAEVNHTDASGCTPLIHAARSGESENVRILLAHGANVNAQNHEGHTALISALLPPAAKVRLLFNSENESIRPEALQSLSELFDSPSGTEQTVRLLLEAGADSTLRDASGRSAFDYAASPELKALLIQGPGAR